MSDDFTNQWGGFLALPGLAPIPFGPDATTARISPADGYMSDGPAPLGAGQLSAQALTASFSPDSGTLSVFGDAVDNTITTGRNAAGKIHVNGGAVSVSGGTPTVANAAVIQVFGLGGNDALKINEANRAMPHANLFGGAGDDTLTGGSGQDPLFGQSGSDVLLGKAGADLLFGGSNDDMLTGGQSSDQLYGESGYGRMIWNPGDGTDLHEGGDGIDTSQVNGEGGAEVFTTTANGTRVRFDRLGPSPFAIDISTTEHLVVDMKGGNDVFSATGNLAAPSSTAARTRSAAAASATSSRSTLTR
jgi:RTX calcium-binding nonapeptide repeat (4 copies)